MPAVRTSNRAKKLKGTDQPSRMVDLEAVAPSSEPECPHWFPSEAMEEWHSTIADIRNIGSLSAAYAEPIARLAVARWEYGVLTSVVMTESLFAPSGVVATGVGDITREVKSSPAMPSIIKARTDAETRILRLEKEFGLTPASISRIRKAEDSQKDDNPFAALDKLQ